MTRKKRKTQRGPARSEPAGDYEVGYRKPPAEHRFQTGRSGNPRGRPRGRKNFAQMLTSILHGKVSITERSGRVRHITRAEAMLQNVIAKAVSGEPKQVELVVDLMDRFDVKVIEQPAVKGITIRYVNPKTPRRYKGGAADATASVQAAEDRWERKRKAAQTPPTERPSQQPAAPQPVHRRNYPFAGRQRRC